MTWQPIESAPTGEYVPMLIWDGQIICVAERMFIGNSTYWLAIGASGYECENDFGEPTHWMPLPEPPTSKPGT